MAYFVRKPANSRIWRPNLARYLSTSNAHLSASKLKPSPWNNLASKKKSSKTLSTGTYQSSEPTRGHGIPGIDRTGTPPKKTVGDGLTPQKPSFYRNIIKYGGIAILIEAALILGGVGGVGWWGVSKTDTVETVQNESMKDEQEVIRDTYVFHMNQLREKEQRGKFYTVSGDVIRFHGVQHSSNSPCEDEMTFEKIDSIGSQKWAYWAVFDGHAGGATSKLLKAGLITEVAKNLTRLKSEDETINENIKSTFKKVDNQIIQRGLDALYSISGHDSEKTKTVLAQAYAGSCALLAMFDPSTSSLRVAVSGDSRAVLGQYSSTGYTAKPLSIDQNGKNPLEAERMARDHPGEDNVINPRSGRVLGIAISRAFGDARWKWNEEDSLLAAEKYGGPRMRGLGPPGSVKTPPYLTAEPEIIEHTVAMGKSVENADFLIMASDGFWDHISSEDAVTCVAEWVKHQSYYSKHHQKVPPGISDHNDRRLWSAFGKESPIAWPLKEGSGVWGDWKVIPADFVYEEQNAATHLVQNAFGGRRRGLFCGAMAEKYPMSRWARDDISVYVVFFGKVGGKTIVDEPELRVI